MFGAIGLAILSGLGRRYTHPGVLDVGFICPFVVIDPTNQGATTVVAPGRMIDNFLLLPDAESLPLNRMVLMQSCVCVCVCVCVITNNRCWLL
jgi:hypothetical protein